MFAAVMLDEQNAKGLLERILNIEIDRVEVEQEKSIVYNPEYKGVRLDVYVKDDNGTRFNVEMQAANKEIIKRSRYYHSQIDMDILRSGAEYEEMPDSYVIFICDYDPIGLGKYKYSVRKTLEEDSIYNYSDGSHTVFLSTVGKNDDEMSDTLVKFLKYVGASPESVEDDFDDEYVSQLQNSVKKIKVNREMEGRYMLFEEMMRDEFKAGKAEGMVSIIVNLLEQKHIMPDNLKSRIQSVNEENSLLELSVKASKVESIEEFEKALTEMGF